jgi:metallo-beta-lactamase family protein
LLLEVAGRRILFSGDLGRPDDSLMNPPSDPPNADTVLLESTYGDRSHPTDNLGEELAAALRKVAARGGVAVVPVFAVGRAQAILHSIAELKAQGNIPHGLPIFLDSPMAIHTTALFDKHMGEHRLTDAQVKAMDHVATMVETPEQSKALIKRHGPMVILAASGSKTIRMHGKDLQVEAEIVQLSSASAHADANQLLAWLGKMPQPPSQVYVVHGEIQAADCLRQRIERELNLRAVVPEHDSVWPG